MMGPPLGSWYWCGPQTVLVLKPLHYREQWKFKKNDDSDDDDNDDNDDKYDEDDDDLHRIRTQQIMLTLSTNLCK